MRRTLKSLLLSACAAGFTANAAGYAEAAEPANHPIVMEDTMMGDAGAALIRDGANSNMAAEAFKKGFWQLNIPNIVLGTDLKVKDNIINLMNAIDYMSELGDTEGKTPEEIKDKVMGVQDLNDAFFTAKSSAFPYLRLWHFTLGPYAVAKADAALRMPKGVTEDNVKQKGEDFEIELGNQGKLVYLNGNADVGGLLSFAFPIYDKDGFGVAVATTARGFYRFQVDFEYSLPEKVNTKTAEDDLSIEEPKLKRGWGLAFDVSALVKLTDYAKVGIIANDVYDYVSGVSGNSTNLELGCAVHPFAWTEFFKNIALAFDVSDVIGNNERRYEFGVELPFKFGEWFTVAPRAGYSSSFADSFEGDKATAGLQLLLGVLEIQGAYVKHLNRKYEGRDVPSYDAVFVGLTFRN